MGCGCGKANLANRPNRFATAKAASHVTPKKTNDLACIQKYDELAQLDKKAIALYKKFRMVGEMGYRYAEIQKTIRGWIVNLKTECPDEDDLKEFGDFINSEYAKYFG